MSLISTLNIGKSALAAHQAALQVTSNNIANAGNPDYTRQVPRLLPGQDQPMGAGVMVGGGINLTGIERQIDEALEGRLRNSISDSESAQVRQQWLGQVGAVFNELTDGDLSSQFSKFFGSWSDLANKPQDMGKRQLVVQNGETLANSLRDVHDQLAGLQSNVDKRMGSLIDQANALADQVAEYNRQIALAEGTSGQTANGLRDQRDASLKQLSALVDVKVQDLGNGLVNVLVGSTPLVLGAVNQGMMLKQEADGGTLVSRVVTKKDNAALGVGSGQIGALLSVRKEIDGVAGQMNTLAGNLINELNKVHASGQPLEGLTQVTAGNSVADPGAALDSAAASLAFPPSNGSFVIHVKQKATDLATSTLVTVDLDGRNGDDTTLESLRATLDGIDGINASISGGKLKIQADSGVEFSFSQDSSGVLASLGINTFFTGNGARDIAVRAELKSSPGLLAAARNGQPTDNQTAQAIAGLESTAIPSLGDSTLKDRYQAMIDGLAVSAANAKTSAEAAQAVEDTLTTQREALSGVSLDEEAINLMREQRAFQGAARVISAVDELMQTLLQMV